MIFILERKRSKKEDSLPDERPPWNSGRVAEKMAMECDEQVQFSIHSNNTGKKSKWNHNYLSSLKLHDQTHGNFILL